MQIRMIKWVSILSILTVTVTFVLGCTAQAPKATNPEEFYRGKTVKWIVASEPGSGTDLLARAIAPYLSKQIGGTVKVENMGTDEGMNFLYNQAPRDGLTMGIKSSNALISNDILKAPGTQYEVEKFNFIADALPSRTVMEVSPKLPYKTLEELRKAKGLKAAASSAKGTLAILGAVTIELLGLDAKIITGYKSSKDATLALARGEADFLVLSDNSAGKDESDGYVVNMLTIGPERSQVVPKVPTILEQGVKVSKELESAFKYASTAGYAVALPPQVSQDRVDYLRKAFSNLAESKEYQQDIVKVTQLWTPPTSGKDFQDTVLAIKGNKELAQQLDSIFDKYKAVQ